MASKVSALVKLAKRKGLLRPRDLAAHGIPRAYLKRLEAKGILDRVGRGLYLLHDLEVTEHHSLAEAAKRVPQCVVCLLSALRYHGMTTQAPFQAWLALDIHGKAPRGDRPPLRIVRMSTAARSAGVLQVEIEGVPVKIFSQAKTVADCFKFRNRIGLDVAIEALRDYLREHRGSVDELTRAAMTCRVWNVMRPYLEAMV